MSERIGRVIAVHPKRRTVDLVMGDNGARIADVQVSTGSAGSDAGSWDVPSVKPPSTEAGPDVLDPNARNLLCRVGLVAGRPVVTGWMTPQSSQLAFGEDDRTVHRHASGAYTTTAPDGSMETYHPSGAFFRIGAGGHQDLADVSADGNWAIPAGAAPPQITLHTDGFTLTIMPGGAVKLEAAGKLVLQYDKAELHGDVKIFGSLAVTGGVSANSP